MNDNVPQLSDIETSTVKRIALSYVTEAFAEAELDGIETDCVVQAALFAAFRELILAYGEDATAEYAALLPDRIRSGAFSTSPKH